MSKKTKIWLITAFCLILAGSITFAGVMTVLEWDFSKLSTVKYETKTYEISDSFGDISILTDTADIDLVPSEDGACRVVCHEDIKAPHLVEVADSGLEIKLKNNKKWYEHIGINIGTPRITVYLPEGEYGALTVKESTGDIQISDKFSFASIDIKVRTGSVRSYASAQGDIKIKTTTGGINIENISASALELRTTTGRINAHGVSCDGDIYIGVTTGRAALTDITCNNLKSQGDTGGITMKDLVAAGKLIIERDTGSVCFEDCDAAELDIKTVTGSVKGSLLTEKVFIAKSDTGRIRVPESITGGKCKIETDTGNIKITLSEDKNFEVYGNE
ncbi:MAG: DUF4097 family beta strand repeat protein [Clostridia bacterium]|nr:DUF4097 family beta strand repeat protein [Clostridia bacterium]